MSAESMRSLTVKGTATARDPPPPLLAASSATGDVIVTTHSSVAWIRPNGNEKATTVVPSSQPDAAPSGGRMVNSLP